MTFSFHPEAETEFLEAIEYYEERERGLGYDFSKILSPTQVHGRSLKKVSGAVL